MFCPRCKAVYRRGFTTCSDCQVTLVERLPADALPEGVAQDLVVVRTFRTVIDAQVAKTALDSVGIDSMLRSDNEGGQAPSLSLIRGVDLLVRADDADAAADVLAVDGLADNQP